MCFLWLKRTLFCALVWCRRKWNTWWIYIISLYYTHTVFLYILYNYVFIYSTMNYIKKNWHGGGEEHCITIFTREKNFWLILRKCRIRKHAQNFPNFSCLSPCPNTLRCLKKKGRYVWRIWRCFLRKNCENCLISE